MKHLDIRVTGRVQGVFFRASAQRKAYEYGLTGTVCNEADGSVAIEVEGDELSLTRFTDWCRVGPSGADVSRVHIVESEPKNHDGFIITG